MYLAEWAATQVAVKVLIGGQLASSGEVQRALALSAPIQQKLEQEASLLASLRCGGGGLWVGVGLGPGWLDGQEPPMLALLLPCCLPRHLPSSNPSHAGTPMWSTSWPSAASHPASSPSTAPAAAWLRCGWRGGWLGLGEQRLQPTNDCIQYLLQIPCPSLLLSRPHQVLAAARTDPAVAAHLTWPRRLAMAADAAAGMLYVHTRPSPIVHRGR